MGRLSGIALAFFCSAALAACEADKQPVASTMPATSSADQEEAPQPQIERNWNLGFSDECPLEERKPVDVRIHLASDGTITKVEPVTDISNDTCVQVTFQGVERAVMMSSPLKLPPGKTYTSMVLRFDPAQVVR
jgi:hypothetical protein